MINAIIIDDEKKCVSLLEKMIGQSLPDIHILATATQPEEGIKLIRQYEPDLVFLDIEMPKKNGFEVLEATKDIPYEIIFTTAYNQYAIKAIRFSALDYLLKPVDSDELTHAVQRYKSKHISDTRQQQLEMLFSNLKNLSQPFHKISVTTLEGVIFINTNDILYCEATGSYTILYLRNGEKLTTSRPLKDFEELLHEHSFFRIHHSYLININEMKRYVKGDGGFAIMSNNTELPVSKRKKEEFLKKLHL
jgi:two-component system, LytTR family, response regulator